MSAIKHASMSCEPRRSSSSVRTFLRTLEVTLGRGMGMSESPRSVGASEGKDGVNHLVTTGRHGAWHSPSSICLMRRDLSATSLSTVKRSWSEVSRTTIVCVCVWWICGNDGLVEKVRKRQWTRLLLACPRRRRRARATTCLRRSNQLPLSVRHVDAGCQTRRGPPPLARVVHLAPSHRDDLHPRRHHSCIYLLHHAFS